MKISDIMTTEVVSVPPELPFKGGAPAARAIRASGLPVIDDSGALRDVGGVIDVVSRLHNREPNPRSGGVLGVR